MCKTALVLFWSDCSDIYEDIIPFSKNLPAYQPSRPSNSKRRSPQAKLDAEHTSQVYSRVHISSDTAFLKILKKPSIVQE